MGKIGKTFASILILVITISYLILLAINPTNAQTIPTPSVPQFTVKFINASYTFTTTNAYTGLNEIEQVVNDSIELSLKNQPFSYSNGNTSYQLYINVQAKPHFSNNWTDVYPLAENGKQEFLSFDTPVQSFSQYTTITFPVITTQPSSASSYDIQRYYSGEQTGQQPSYQSFLQNVPSGGQVDFQVQAIIGHDTQTYVIPPFTSIGEYEPAIAYDSSSGWSTTQTVTIGQTSPTPTSTPAVPELSWLAIVPLLFSLFGVAVIVRHRKTADLKQ